MILWMESGAARALNPLSCNDPNTDIGEAGRKLQRGQHTVAICVDRVEDDHRIISHGCLQLLGFKRRGYEPRLFSQRDQDRLKIAFASWRRFEGALLARRPTTLDELWGWYGAGPEGPVCTSYVVLHVGTRSQGPAGKQY